MNYLKIGARLSFCIIAFLLARQAAAKDTEFDVHETEHFILNFESTERIRNTISLEDAEKMLEALWVELDREIGVYCAISDMKKEEMGITYPKCNIYLLDGDDSFSQVTQKHGVKPPTRMSPQNKPYMCDFYSESNYSVYLRTNYYIAVKEGLLHESTHFYFDVKLPGKLKYYPVWFYESVATFFGLYYWDGQQLNQSINRNFYVCGGDLKRVEEKLALTTRSNQDEKLNLLTLDDYRFTSKSPRFYSTKEHDLELYGIYNALGGYLFQVQPEIIQNVIQQLSESNLFDMSLPQKDAAQIVLDAFRSVSKDTPILMIDIEAWLKSITSIQCTYAEQGESPLYKKDLKQTENGFLVSSAMFRMRFNENLDTFPAIRVELLSYPEMPHRSVIMINRIDRDNFEVLEVNKNGTVVYRSKKNGTWSNGESIFQLLNETDTEYQWYGKKNGSDLEVYINDEKVYTWKEPHKNGYMGIMCIEGIYSVELCD